jgi:hypothetical protein
MEEVYELTHDPAHTWNPHDQVAEGSTMTENDRSKAYKIACCWRFRKAISDIAIIFAR